jgi:uncharacterized protein YjgD (DUF1641 family)
MDQFILLVDKIIIILDKLSSATFATNKITDNLSKLTDKKFMSTLISNLTNFYNQLTQNIESFIT